MGERDDALRAILQNDYCTYCEFVNTGWIPSKFHRYLCDRVQSFFDIEKDNTY